VWSPPAWMKTNRRTFDGGALEPRYYPHFARYLAEWIRFVREEYGITLYALGPQNEPAFVEPYTSAVYKPGEYARMLAVLADTFAREGIDVKIFGPEDMTHSLGRTTKYIKAAMADPRAGPRLDVIATHGYVDGLQSTGSPSESSDFWNAIKGYGRPYWMTETGYRGDVLWRDGGVDGVTMDLGPGRTATLRSGVLSDVAGRLHYGLVYGQASAWTFWQIIGAGYTTEAGYSVLQQFYRFIRPGSVRIGAGPDGDERGVRVSAWLHPQTGASAIVLINRSDDNAHVTLKLTGGLAVTSFDSRRTSEIERFVDTGPVAAAQGQASVTLPPRSIVTLHARTAGTTAFR